MSMFANHKNKSLPYTPWKILREERVINDNCSEIKRIKAKKGWYETNLKKVDRWIRRRPVKARACLVLLTRIAEREG